MLKTKTQAMELPIASWQWKVEPVSPPFVPVDNEPETWLFEDDLTHFASPACPEEEKKPLQPTRAEIAAKLLDDLDEWIKKEPFSDWLEEKTDLPIFEDIPAVESHGYGHFSRGNDEAVRPFVELEVKGHPVPPAQLMVNDTQALLQEFESVYGAVELNNGPLTPPLSPTLSSFSSVLPQSGNGSPLLITTLQQLVPVRLPPKKEPQGMLEQLVPVTVVPELAPRDELDELVRSCVQDLETMIPVSNAWSENASSSAESSSEPSSIAPPSPCTSSNSSFESSDDQSNDSDWIPSSLQSDAPGSQKSTGGRKRSKPYARAGVEDKRMRKKEQNKNAATRYRQKKKAEIEEILSEEKGLEDKNNELRHKVSDLAREIKYLKGLMRDVFRAKGMIK